MKKVVLILAFLIAFIPCVCACAITDTYNFQSAIAGASIDELLLLREMIDEELNCRYQSADGFKEKAAAYILNTNSQKFHIPSCDSAIRTKEKNKKEYQGSREELLDMGYTPCGICNP